MSGRPLISISRGSGAPIDFAGPMLHVLAVLAMVPQISRLLRWTARHGFVPVDVRSVALVLLVLTIGIAVARKPAICLPAIGVFLLTILRFCDAALLRRYECVTIDGGHSAYVTNFTAGLLVMTCGVLVLFSKNGYAILRSVAVGTIVIIAGSIYYEWLGFERFSEIFPGRMVGFLEDPNNAAMHINLMFGILLTVGTRFWPTMALAAFSAPAIALTFSRGGTLIFVGMVLIYLAANFRRHALSLGILGLVALPLLGSSMVWLQSATAEQGGRTNSNAGGRLEAIYNLDFDKLKSAERAKDVSDGLEAAMRGPLLGYGTGCAGSHWQPHNEFVAIWLEFGLVGLGCYLAMLIAITIASAMQGWTGGFCLVPLWAYTFGSQELLDLPAYLLCAAVCSHVLSKRRYSLTFSLPESVPPQAAYPSH